MYDDYALTCDSFRADTALKLYIYGYLNRVRSSRRLEAECHRNIEVIWLLRTLKPVPRK